MHKDRKDSGSMTDTTLLVGTGRLLEPEEQNGRCGNIQASGGQKDPPKPELRGGESAAGRAITIRQQEGAGDSYRPSSASPRRKSRHRHRGPKESRNNTSGRTNPTSRRDSPHNPGGRAGSTYISCDYHSKSVIGAKAGPGSRYAHKHTGTPNNTVPASGSRRGRDLKGGHEANRRPANYRRWQGKVSRAKNVLQQILNPLRTFFHNKAHLRVVPNGPGGEVPTASKIKVPAVETAKSRPRIVVDTNVIMGGLINRSKASGRIIGLWLEGKVDVVVSPALLDEYLYIFNKMRFGPREALGRREEAMKKLLRHENVAVVEPELKLRVVKEDPSDDRLIECAVSGSADYIISQDRHLLTIGEYSGIKILRAHTFLLQEYPERTI